jgi:hypothetical protein
MQTIQYAVLTGDLKGSSKVSPDRLEATMLNIANSAEFMRTYTGAETRFTRFRGDGWQMIVAPQYYLRTVALIMARLKMDSLPLSTRIGIGVGTVESLGTTDLSDARGHAFEYSGHALDNLTRDRDLTIQKGALDPVAYLGRKEHRPRLAGQIGWTDAAILTLFGHIVSNWTRLQAEAVAYSLENDTANQGTIAGILGITRQALNLRLTGAGYGPVISAIKLTELYFPGYREDEGTP